MTPYSGAHNNVNMANQYHQWQQQGTPFIPYLVPDSNDNMVTQQGPRQPNWSQYSVPRSHNNMAPQFYPGSQPANTYPGNVAQNNYMIGAQFYSQHHNTELSSVTNYNNHMGNQSHWKSHQGGTNPQPLVRSNANIMAPAPRPQLARPNSFPTFVNGHPTTVTLSRPRPANMHQSSDAASAYNMITGNMACQQPAQSPAFSQGFNPPLTPQTNSNGSLNSMVNHQQDQISTLNRAFNPGPAPHTNNFNVMATPNQQIIQGTTPVDLTSPVSQPFSLSSGTSYEQGIEGNCALMYNASPIGQPNTINHFANQPSHQPVIMGPSLHVILLQGNNIKSGQLPANLRNLINKMDKDRPAAVDTIHNALREAELEFSNLIEARASPSIVAAFFRGTWELAYGQFALGLMFDSQFRSQASDSTRQQIDDVYRLGRIPAKYDSATETVRRWGRRLMDSRDGSLSGCGWLTCYLRRLVEKATLIDPNTMERACLRVSKLWDLISMPNQKLQLDPAVGDLERQNQSRQWRDSWADIVGDTIPALQKELNEIVDGPPSAGQIAGQDHSQAAFRTAFQSIPVPIASAPNPSASTSQAQALVSPASYSSTSTSSATHRAALPASVPASVSPSVPASLPASRPAMANTTSQRFSAPIPTQPAASSSVPAQAPAPVPVSVPAFTNATFTVQQLAVPGPVQPEVTAPTNTVTTLPPALTLQLAATNPDPTTLSPADATQNPSEDPETNADPDSESEEAEKHAYETIEELISHMEETRYKAVDFFIKRMRRIYPYFVTYRQEEQFNREDDEINRLFQVPRRQTERNERLEDDCDVALNQLSWLTSFDTKAREYLLTRYGQFGTGIDFSQMQPFTVFVSQIERLKATPEHYDDDKRREMLDDLGLFWRLLTDPVDVFIGTKYCWTPDGRKQFENIVSDDEVKEAKERRDEHFDRLGRLIESSVNFFKMNLERLYEASELTINDGLRARSQQTDTQTAGTSQAPKPKHDGQADGAPKCKRARVSDSGPAKYPGTLMRSSVDLETGKTTLVEGFELTDARSGHVDSQDSAGPSQAPKRKHDSEEELEAGEAPQGKRPRVQDPTLAVNGTDNQTAVFSNVDPALLHASPVPTPQSLQVLPDLNVSLTATLARAAPADTSSPSQTGSNIGTPLSGNTNVIADPVHQGPKNLNDDEELEFEDEDLFGLEPVQEH